MMIVVMIKSQTLRIPAYTCISYNSIAVSQFMSQSVNLNVIRQCGEKKFTTIHRDYLFI